MQTEYHKDTKLSVCVLPLLTCFLSCTLASEATKHSVVHDMVTISRNNFELPSNPAEGVGGCTVVTSRLPINRKKISTLPQR